MQKEGIYLQLVLVKQDGVSGRSILLMLRMPRSNNKKKKRRNEEREDK